jgi:hypothetical protein
LAPTTSQQAVSPTLPASGPAPSSAPVMLVALLMLAVGSVLLAVRRT